VLKQAAMLAVLILLSGGTLSAQGNWNSLDRPVGSLSEPTLSWDMPARSGALSEPYYPLWDVGIFVGGATTPGNATLALKKTGSALFNQMERKVDLDLSGILIGLSLERYLTERLSGRIEAFDLVPSSEKSQTVTILQTGGPVKGQSIFDFDWAGVHGEGVVRIWGGLALLGGVRYESLNLRLATPTTGSSHLITVVDNGKIDFHAFNLYAGAEYSLALPYSSKLLVRAVGFPWVYCHWDYDMTFQDPISLSFINNTASDNIQKGSFGEILVRGGFGLRFAELGGFVKLNVISLGTSVGLNSESSSFGIALQQPFDMTFTRRTIEAGIFAAIPF
jgi:hypothetical protein